MSHQQKQNLLHKFDNFPSPLDKHARQIAHQILQHPNLFMDQRCQKFFLVTDDWTTIGIVDPIVYINAAIDKDYIISKFDFELFKELSKELICKGAPSQLFVNFNE